MRVASEENGKLGGSGGGGGGGEVAQDGGPNRRHSTGPTGSASTRQGAPSIIKDAGSRSVKSTAAVGKSHKRKSSAPGPFVALPSALLQPGGPHRPTTEAEDEGESIESAGEGEALELQAAWRLRTYVCDSSPPSPGPLLVTDKSASCCKLERDLARLLRFALAPHVLLLADVRQLADFPHLAFGDPCSILPLPKPALHHCALRLGSLFADLFVPR